jgi:long-chain fatty acid transport protein
LNNRRLFAIAAASSCLAASSVHADGFLLDQTARASGAADAVVAQVNDPSAIFFNPGALGLMKKKKGVVLGVTESELRPFQYQGLPPGPGAGTAGEQKTSLNTLPHAFATLPYGKRIVYGLGAYNSFRANTDWTNPDTFSGRFLATQSQIESTDVTAAAGMQIVPGFGIGAGAIYRTSKISLTRHINANLSGTLRDIASQTIKTDSQSTTGWTAGMLIRPSPAFALGASYRSDITTTFNGAGKLTQVSTGDTQLDQLVAASFPFNQNVAIRSQLAMPAQLTAGAAFGSETVTFEVDGTRTNWKRMQQIVFDFPNNPSLSTTYPLNLKDTTDIRVGIKYQFPTGPIVRAGYSVEKSPQPNETLSPFFAALGRNTATLGFGLDWLDVAVGWSTFSKRSITTSVNGFNGNYRGNEWVFAMTATK